MSSVKTIGFALILAGLGLVPRTIAAAQRTVPLPIEDLLDIQEFGTFSPLQFSPDGKWVVYTTQENRKSATADVKEDSRTGVPFYVKGDDVCIVNTHSREARNLTGGKGANWAPEWSPDGHYLAFLSDRDNSGQAKLWLWEAKTNRLKKVSDVALQATKLTWMPNSEQVLATILPETLNLEDHAERVLESGTVTAGQQGARLHGLTVVLYKAGRVRQDERPEGSSDPWSLERYRGDLALVNVGTSQVQPLVRGARISKYVPSPDGSYVAFSSPDRFEKPGSQQILWNLSVVNVSTQQVAVLASDVRFEYDGASFSWSPDSSVLAYMSGGPLEMKSGTADCYLVDLKGRPPRNVTMFTQQGSSSKQRQPLWDASGQSIYLIRGDSIWTARMDQGGARKLVAIPGHRIVQFVEQGANRLWSADGGKSTILMTYDVGARQSGFYRVDLESGRFAMLSERGQCYTCVNTRDVVSGQPDGNRLVYFSQDPQHADDLWMIDSDFRRVQPLTHMNPQLDKYPMGSPRLIEWRSLDGDLLHGALLLPSGYQESKRYPLIVWVYGGSTGSDHLSHFGLADGAPFNLQLLATRGYAVLFPDAPQHLGTPMLDLAKAVLPGVDKVIEMGIADPDRLGVMGHSYGGYSALSLVVLTKRFKAAVVESGTGNLLGEYGELGKDGTAFGISIAELGRGLMGGTPWEFRDRYIENSPLFFLDRVDTPLLIVHGGEDTTVGPFLADEVFVGLRRLGKDVEYAKYLGEGHSPVYWGYQNQSDFCNRIISWFGKYLK